MVWYGMTNKKLPHRKIVTHFLHIWQFFYSSFKRSELRWKIDYYNWNHDSLSFDNIYLKIHYWNIHADYIGNCGGQYVPFLIKKSPLEDSDLSAFQGEGVIINGEEEDEGEEEGGGAEEVPHVVIVKEVHHTAWLVQVARLGWGQVSALVSIEVKHHGHSCKAEGKEDAEASTEDKTEPHVPVLCLPLSAVHHLQNFVANVVEQEGGHVCSTDHQNWGRETLRARLEGARQEEAHKDEVDEDKNDGKGKALGV